MERRRKLRKLETKMLRMGEKRMSSERKMMKAEKRRERRWNLKRLKREKVIEKGKRRRVEREEMSQKKPNQSRSNTSVQLREVTSALLQIMVL